MNRKLLTALLALCAALCLLPALALAEGAADVAIDPTNFPDANFLAYVGSFDTDNDKLLSPAELTKVKEMTLINKSIGDLTGIEHFTALTKLDCCWNQLTSLDVSKNTALEELDCGDNQLTSLDVSANTALKQLYCMNNPLTALDVSKNTSLTDLNCINTQRASLDVSKNTALTSLRCAQNQLASLDVSKNTALEDLDFRWNQLTSLDVSKNAALKDLDYRWNQLTSLDLSANPKLSFSKCSTTDNTYRLTLDESRTLDLTTLPGSFDVTKASYWSGGTVVGTVLTVDGGAEQVTYSYDCGNGITAYFTLTCDKARYTVTFDNDRAPAQTVTHGEKAAEPPKPTSPGHIFKAWYAENAPYDFNTPVTQDLHLEAWWDICTHSGSTEKSSCTATAVCTVCGGTIEKLGHDWGDWTPSSNKTHTRTCKTDSTHTETKNCADDNKDHVCDTCGATLTQHSGGTASCTAPATCGYCGKPYGEKNPANHSDLKHVPAKAATTQAEGNSEYWLCSGCGKCYKDAAAATEIALSDTVIAKRIPRRYSGPTITVMGAAYYDGGNVGLTFVSSADFDTFTGVQVDGKTLAAKNYIAERGSIEVYLKAVYLRTLKNGSHTVTIQSTAGDVSAVFTVENSKTSPGTSDPGVTVYALSSMLSLTGLAALRRRKEG